MAKTIKSIAFEPGAELDPDKLNRSRGVIGTIVVRENADLYSVAVASDQLNTSLILTVNDQDAITGVIVPKSIVERLAKQRGVPVSNLTQGILILSEDWDDEVRKLRSEINDDRRKMIWCLGGGGHYTSQPCPIH